MRLPPPGARAAVRQPLGDAHGVRAAAEVVEVGHQEPGEMRRVREGAGVPLRGDVQLQEVKMFAIRLSFNTYEQISMLPKSECSIFRYHYITTTNVWVNGCSF